MQEVAPLGISGTLVEPGGARTEFRFGSSKLAARIEAYDATPVAMTRAILQDTSRLPIGDPARMAAIMIASVEQDPAPKRITLGSDAYATIHKALTDRLAASKRRRSSRSPPTFPKPPDKEPSLMKATQQQVWLVTGSAHGLGRAIADEALAAGHKLVATARDPSQLVALVQRYGDCVRTAAVDVRDASAARDAIKVALDAFGRLDVVVNNAGYGQIAPFEQLSEEDFRALIDTCFYGVVNMTRAALPTMRAQRSGHIIQISSVGGRMATPGSAAYHAAKWAVGGFTEGLAQEVAPFGVKMCTVEPGGMRTNWGARASGAIPALLSDYEPSVGAFANLLSSYWGHETSDPRKVARLVIRLAANEKLPAHLLVGSDAVQRTEQVEAARAAEARRWRDVSVSTDVNAPNFEPALPV
jgi:NAD(P)-dependent dehydrogenase (short-subunit alcohol dehydrogenase family)